MAIQPTEGRNLPHFARKIIGEKLIQERRGWENMAANKHHEDVAMLGRNLLDSYRSLMLGVSSIDFLDIDASNLSSNVVNMTENSARLLNSLTRYLLIELTMEQMDQLLSDVAKSIIQWNISNRSDVFVYKEVDGEMELTVAKDTETGEAVELLVDRLSTDMVYLTLVLLADLHHLTFVASADQCYEILSST